MTNRFFKIFLIVLLSIIVIALTIFFIYILNNENNISKYINFSYKVNNELVFNQEYDDTFENIQINSKSSDIEIKESTDSKVKVLIYGKKDETNVDTINQELSITSSEKGCVGFCFTKRISKIEVYIPNDYSGKTNIISNYGDIRINKFDNLVLDATLDAGDIKVDSLKSGKIKDSYGDIKILGYSKELEIDQSSGDTQISDVDRIKINNKYGDIKIGKVNEYLNIKEESGDVNIDSVDLKENSTIQCHSGDTKIGSTNKIYIDTKTKSGDIKINNNYRKSDVTLTINNSSGDITINN